MNQVRALISAKYLADILLQVPKSIRILDSTFFLPKVGQNARTNYLKEHIPGALFFDIDECTRPSEYKRMLPSAEDFNAFVGALGIDNKTHVVVYNNHPDYAVYSAPRVWWSFRVFGHEAVSVLDCGLRGWKDAGYPVHSGEGEMVEPKQFWSNYKPELVKTFEEVLGNIESKEFQLVDARSTGRFNGTALDADQDTKPGHIPGSVNLPSRSVQGPYTCPDGTVLDHGRMKSVTQLQQLFLNNGIDLDRPMATTCGSGVTACNVALAAYLCGKKDVSVYDGSWTEWYKRSTPKQRNLCPDEGIHK